MVCVGVGVVVVVVLPGVVLRSLTLGVRVLVAGGPIYISDYQNIGRVREQLTQPRQCPSAQKRKERTLQSTAFFFFDKLGKECGPKLENKRVCVRSKGRHCEVYPEYDGGQIERAEGQSFIASPLCLHVITIRDGACHGSSFSLGGGYWNDD